MNDSQLDRFTKEGYIKIKNAITKKLICEIGNTILSSLTKKKVSLNNLNLLSKKFEKYIISQSKRKVDMFKIQKDIFQIIKEKNLIHKILLSKKVHSKISTMIGSDLQFQDPSEFIINHREKEEGNYLFKKYHQEIWSGASTNTILIWIPIFQNTTKGQMKLIKGSHLWGHIPHHDKKPIKLPNKYNEISSNCNLGDIVLFHTMILHRSEILPQSSKVVGRLSLAVKNFKYPSTGFDNLSDWKIYNLSPHSVIEKKLGNPQLSPFRLSEGEIKKK